GSMAREEHFDGRDEGEEIRTGEQLPDDAETLTQRPRVVVQAADHGTVDRCGLERGEPGRLDQAAPRKRGKQLLVWLAAALGAREIAAVVPGPPEVRIQQRGGDLATRCDRGEAVQARHAHEAPAQHLAEARPERAVA